jgi:transcriptional regulator with XRE-family HTH domain
MPKKMKYELEPLDINFTKIGNNIAQLRKKRGLTQSELGAKIGITQAHVSDYETERSHLSDFMIIRFALALQTTPNNLLGFKQNNSDKKNDPGLKLMKRFYRIKKLPLSKQKALLQIIDGFLDGTGV